MFRKYMREETSEDYLASRDAFKFLDYGVTVLGWNLNSKERLHQCLYKIWALLILVLSVHMPVGLMITYVKEFKNFTPNELLTSAQLAFNIPNSLIKGFIFYLSLRRLERIKELLDLMDKSCTADEEKMQLHRTVARCNLIYLTYVMIYFFFPLTTFTAALFSGTVPWNIYNPVLNWRDGRVELLGSSVIEIVEILIACVLNQIPDVFPVIDGLILRVHIDLLKDRILGLRTDPGKSDEESYKELSNCIADHKNILELCRLIRPVISRTLFIQLLLVGVLLGICLTNMFFFADLWSALVTAVYIIGISSQTFPFCYICNLLEEDGEALTLAMFQSNWIDASPRYKSALILFLHNVQKPIEFIAGGIFPVCMRTNLSLAKFAFTVVTLVKQFNLAEKLKND